MNYQLYITMKHLHKLLVLGLICLIPLTSCNTDELQELNIDPNAANELDWKFMFSWGTLQAAENRYVNGRVNLGICSHLIQQMASIEAGERAMGDKYTRNEDAKNGYMWFIYRNSLKTLAEVIRQTGPEGTNPEWTNLQHMAQVMYIIPMHVMTDLYGNVPYTEANKGIDGIFFPAYDNQEFIYRDMLAKLETAANTIGTGPDEVGQSDIMYGGDFDKWKKLANSLMLRLAMRISNVDPGTAQEFAQKAIAGGVMESNDDMAWIQMASGPSQWANQNGIARALIPDDWGANSVLSQTFVNFLQESNDPRLGIFAVTGPWEGPYETDPAAQRGLPNGLDAETLVEFDPSAEASAVVNTFARMNPLLLNVDDPFIFMTYAEVEFLQAEAALKGWTTADAATHYNAGIRGAMQMYDIFDPSFAVDDATVDAYLAANPFDGTEESVGEQIWAANFMNWYEAYSNWRRTGFPTLTPINYPGNISQGQIFRRIQYFTNEIANNPNVQIGGTLPDNYMTRIWWDVN